MSEPTTITTNEGDGNVVNQTPETTTETTVEVSDKPELTDVQKAIVDYFYGLRQYNKVASTLNTISLASSLTPASLEKVAELRTSISGEVTFLHSAILSIIRMSYANIVTDELPEDIQTAILFEQTSFQVEVSPTSILDELFGLFAIIKLNHAILAVPYKLPKAIEAKFIEMQGSIEIIKKFI